MLFQPPFPRHRTEICGATAGAWAGLKWLAPLIGLGVALIAQGADIAAFTRQAESAHQAAWAAYQTNRTDVGAAWKLARACFDRAEFASGDKQRESLAEQGIEACRDALRRAPADATANYYLAMNLGQLARTKTLGALKIVKEMEQVFEQARTLDEHLDYAGPDRSLGMLYLEAPGWPTSIGNRKKAVHHLRRSVELAPGYPENRLNLANALLRSRDPAGANEQLKAVRDLWSTARQTFSGPEWESSWAAWEASRSALERKLGSGEPEPAK